MATDLKAILVRRLGQSPLLDAAQRKELAEQIQGNFTQPKPLLVELHRRGWLTLYQIQQLLQGAYDKHYATLAARPRSNNLTAGQPQMRTRGAFADGRR